MRLKTIIFLLLALSFTGCQIESDYQPEQPDRNWPAVVVYGNPMCPHCRRLTEQLREHRIPYRFLDITADDATRMQLWQLVKKHHPELDRVSLPVVETKGQVLIRPSWSSFLQLLEGS